MLFANCDSLSHFAYVSRPDSFLYPRNGTNHLSKTFVRYCYLTASSEGLCVVKVPRYATSENTARPGHQHKLQ